MRRSSAIQNGGRWLVTLLLMAAVALPCAAQPEAGWRVLRQERDIKVSTREQTGQELPSFRGETTLRGHVLHVLAVVLDDARSTQWAKGADEASVLRTIDERTQLVYSRSHQTWPVRDRDLVMKRQVEVLSPGTQFRVRLTCVPGQKPELPRVIRIRRCETVFLLRKVDDQRTYVDYQVHADPGGSSPDWMVRWASESIPLDTLRALAKQVSKTHGQYQAVMERWAAAR